MKENLGILFLGIAILCYKNYKQKTTGLVLWMNV